MTIFCLLVRLEQMKSTGHYPDIGMDICSMLSRTPASTSLRLKGTPIMAIGPGTVTFAGYGIYYKGNIYADPYGIAVSIKHDFGFAGKEITTVYGHMDETYVYRGQHVEGGEVIGIVGETGKVSGPHLHLEVQSRR